MPSSRTCLTALQQHWCAWAGKPKRIVLDRGLHNRGVFLQLVKSQGIDLRDAGVESPEQIGRTERHGGLWKNVFKKVVHDKNVIGLDEVMTTAVEVDSTKNEMSRVGGFSPSQWVLGRLPRVPGSQFDDEEAYDLGVLANVAEDGSDEFSRQSVIRATARKAFAEHDVGSRTARAVLRKAAPLAGEYQVGDVVCFRKRPTDGEVTAKWSTGSRIVGFDGKNAWVITEGVPVCVAVDRLRPCTAAEALAYQYLSRHQDGSMGRYAPPEGQQQSFVDERRELPDAGQPEAPQGDVLPVIHEEPGLAMPEPMEESQPGAPGEDMSDAEGEAEDPPAEQPGPRSTRTPLQRSLLDDVPHDVRGRSEVMRRRLDTGGSSSERRSASMSEPGPEPANSLLEAWERTGTSGSGVDLLQRRAASIAVKSHDSLVGFFNERTVNKPQSRKKLKSVKNLTYHKESEEVKSGLRLARQDEWGKWRKFNAAVPIDPAELRKLLDDGYRMVPTQWIEIDKNEHLRRPGGPPVAPQYKSRLVVRGDLEESLGIRTDSPTCELEGLRLIISWAAGTRRTLKCADITSAYFQGQELDRLMLLKPPPDGLEGVPDGGALIARMPVYGTRDAGRGLWKKIRQRFKAHGLRENRIMPALFSLSNDKNEITCMIGTHVDDILWAADDESQKIIDSVLAEFDIREVKSGDFRYCGLEVVQDQDYTVHVTAKDNIENIEAVSYPRDSPLTRRCNEGETSQLRSVVGALSWVCRQCKPEFLYRVSRLQTAVNHAKVLHLKEANRVLEEAVQTSDSGLVFKGGAVLWDKDMIVLTITDASWAGEDDVVKGNLEPLRSQRARFNGLAGPGFVEGNSDYVHPI